MDIIRLVEEIEDLIENAGSVPFSKKVMIDADELYDILHDIRKSLPEEIKQANWIAEEKDRILQDAGAEASNIIENAHKEEENIVKDARSRADKMVDDHQIVQEARDKAQAIHEKAEAAARDMKVQSINYVDELLASSQTNLENVLKTISENRNELNK